MGRPGVKDVEENRSLVFGRKLFGSCQCFLFVFFLLLRMFFLLSRSFKSGGFSCSHKTSVPEAA